VTSTPAADVSYRVTRLTVEVGGVGPDSGSHTRMRCRPFPLRRSRSWYSTSPYGRTCLTWWQLPRRWAFYLFANDVEATVRLAGDQASGVAYLMGNSTIMERMLRRQPAILLHAPLHAVIWQNPGGPACFTFDKPSDQFRSFADPDITQTGIELDGKLAALLDHLSVAVPHELLSR
jgi:hypothetical protein